MKLCSGQMCSTSSGSLQDTIIRSQISQANPGFFKRGVTAPLSPFLTEFLTDNGSVKWSAMEVQNVANETN